MGTDVLCGVGDAIDECSQIGKGVVRGVGDSSDALSAFEIKGLRVETRSPIRYCITCRVGRYGSNTEWEINRQGPGGGSITTGSQFPSRPIIFSSSGAPFANLL